MTRMTRIRTDWFVEILKIRTNPRYPCHPRPFFLSKVLRHILHRHPKPDTQKYRNDDKDNIPPPNQERRHLANQIPHLLAPQLNLFIFLFHCQLSIVNCQFPSSNWFFTKLKYAPRFAISSSCVPRSIILPFSKTTIGSAWRTVLSRWATTITVFPR